MPKIYRGHRGTHECTVTVDEIVLGPTKFEDVIISTKELKHRVRHSPDGFEWGYGGSGPSDLALSLCWDVLGEEPTGQLYQSLKFDVIALISSPVWTLTEEYLLKKIERIRGNG